VIIALGRIKASSPEALAAVQSMLDSKDDLARSAALTTLEMFGPQAAPATASVMRMANDPSIIVRCQALRALASIGPAAAEGVPMAFRAIASVDKGERLNAAMTLGPIGGASREAVSALTVALRDPSVNVRQAAAHSLGQIGPAAATAAAPLQLLQEQPEMHLDASFALARITGSPPALAALREMALADNVQLDVFERLTELGEPAVPVLAEVVGKQAVGGRWAIEAIGNMGDAGKGGVEALVNVLKGGRAGKRRSRFDASIEAIRKIGPAANDQAAETLRQIASSSDNPDVRSRAAVALDAIQQAASPATGVQVIPR
jgi:HEAT repeat protein